MDTDDREARDSSGSCRVRFPSARLLVQPGAHASIPFSGHCIGWTVSGSDELDEALPIPRRDGSEAWGILGPYL